MYTTDIKSIKETLKVDYKNNLNMSHNIINFYISI
jgi:hypothetical protein